MRGFDVPSLALGCKDPPCKDWRAVSKSKGVAPGDSKEMGTTFVQPQYLHAANNLNSSQSLPKRVQLASNLVATWGNPEQRGGTWS